jgi:hypothetical protein
MLRFFVALTLIAGAFVLAPKSALALPLALSDHATISKDLSSAVGTVARRSVKARRYGRLPTGRAAITGPITRIGGLISIATGSSTIPTAVRSSRALSQFRSTPDAESP